jgi:hypothetical protein
MTQTKPLQFEMQTSFHSIHDVFSNLKASNIGVTGKKVLNSNELKQLQQTIANYGFNQQPPKYHFSEAEIWDIVEQSDLKTKLGPAKLTAFKAALKKQDGNPLDLSQGTDKKLPKEVKEVFTKYKVPPSAQNTFKKALPEWQKENRHKSKSITERDLQELAVKTFGRDKLIPGAKLANLARALDSLNPQVKNPVNNYNHQSSFSKPPKKLKVNTSSNFNIISLFKNIINKISLKASETKLNNIEKAKQASVLILDSTSLKDIDHLSSNRASASGSIVSSKKLANGQNRVVVLTNQHVVDALNFRPRIGLVLNNGNKVMAETISASMDLNNLQNSISNPQLGNDDLALLAFTANDNELKNTQALELADQKLSKDTPILHVGFPLARMAGADWQSSLKEIKHMQASTEPFYGNKALYPVVRLVDEGVVSLNMVDKINFVKKKGDNGYGHYIVPEKFLKQNNPRDPVVQETTIAATKGNSGGPILKNSWPNSGKLVGVLASASRSMKQGSAIVPIHTNKKLIEKVIERDFKQANTNKK